MTEKADTSICLFSWQIKKVRQGQKPCKGERGSLLALVAMVSPAPSWLLHALQMLIKRVALGGSSCVTLQMGSMSGPGTGPANTIPPIFARTQVCQGLLDPGEREP